MPYLSPDQLEFLRKMPVFFCARTSTICWECRLISSQSRRQTIKFIEGFPARAPIPDKVAIPMYGMTDALISWIRITSASSQTPPNFQAAETE